MEADSELINILCYRLPGDISRAVYNEFENRWKEIEKIWEYPLNQCDFFTTIDKSDTQNEIPIAIGKYMLNRKEYNKLLGIQISFDNIKKGYGLSDQFFDYFETAEFLANCKDLYYSNDRPEQHKSDPESPDEIPF